MTQRLVLVLYLLCLGMPASACLWDRDTLAMERARFPEVNELIVGYFPRHSPAYYEWRKEQVLSIPLAQRTPSDYDDLGVSYDKLGEHEQAIQTMLEKIERFPNEGLYETHANLGTFYIHNGDLEQGAQYIGSAIEINPEAHFGREVYQKLLVEYVIQQRAAENTLPLTQEIPMPFDAHGPGFAAFVLQQQDMVNSDKRMEEIDRATKGVLGMMRFGNYESPVLLEALGDLLVFRFGRNAPQRLAGRAYLKASYEVDDPVAASLYRSKAETAIESQSGIRLESIEADLEKEIAEADTYFAKIKSDETAWATAAKDLDAEFARVYYKTEPLLDNSLIKSATDHVRGMSPEVKALLCLVAVVVSYFLFGQVRRGRKRRESQAKDGVTSA